MLGMLLLLAPFRDAQVGLILLLALAPWISLASAAALVTMVLPQQQV